MLGLRLPELLLILLVVVLLFGARKLPELGDALGKGIRSFKKAAEHGFGSDEPEAGESRSQGQLQAGTATQEPAAPDAAKARQGADRSA